MRNDGPDARSWKTDSVAGPAWVAGVMRDGESFLENHEAAKWPGKRRKCDYDDFLKDAAEAGKFLFQACFSQIHKSRPR